MVLLYEQIHAAVEAGNVKELQDIIQANKINKVINSIAGKQQLAPIHVCALKVLF